VQGLYKERSIGLIEISQSHLLGIKDGNRVFWGGDQAWYKDGWKRKAGCGPTTCSNLVWYFSKKDKSLFKLFPNSGNTKEDMIILMNEVWDYVTPGLIGVNSTGLFENGAVRFFNEKGVPVTSHVLNIPGWLFKRPSRDMVKEFLKNALIGSVPVAFLNFSSGSLGNLHSWHWVMIYAMNEHRMTVYVMDHGRKKEVDLSLWLSTTKAGGGFVAIRPKNYN